MFPRPNRTSDSRYTRLARITACDELRGTLQAALAGAILKLRSEANQSAWKNWDAHAVQCVDLLQKHLSNESAFFPQGVRKQIDLDLAEIYEAGRTGGDGGRFASDELNRVEERVLEWCAAHPETTST